MIGIKRDHQTPAPAEIFDILAIVFVALLLATSFVAYTYYSKLQTAQANWLRATATAQESATFAQSEETVDSLYVSEKEAAEQLVRLSRVAGFYKGEDAVSSIDTLCNTLNEVKTEFKLNYTDATVKSIQDRSVAKGVLTVKAAIAHLEEKIGGIVNDETGGIKVLESKRDKLQGQLDTAEGGDEGKEREQGLKDVQEKQKELDTVQTELKGLRSSFDGEKQRLLEQRSSAEDAVNRARLQKKRVQNELFEINKEYKDKIDELKDTLENVKKGVRSLEDVVRKITNTERDKDQTRADGEILSSNTDMQVAWINLTRNDRALKGMRLEVFRYLKGGKEIPRGSVQVIQVGDKMSRVRILERVYNGKTYTMDQLRLAPEHIVREFQIDPLGLGDMVRNRFFDKSIRRVFVFSGKMTGPPGADVIYKAEELTKLIEEMGDVVHRGVSEETDFIVLGEGYQDDPNFKKAEELGIPKMTERELLEVVGKF